MNTPGFTAEASLYVTNEKYLQLKVDNAFANDRSKSVYPSASFRGCFYGISAGFDCNNYGAYGFSNGWWRNWLCDSGQSVLGRNCPGGWGLATEP